MKVAVLDVKGKETGRKADLSDAVYKMEPNKHAIYLDVKQYMAHQRQGTHSAKERADIVGSTRKLRNKRELGQHEREVLNLRYFVVEEGFLDLDRKIIPKNLIRI